MEVNKGLSVLDGVQEILAMGLDKGSHQDMIATNKPPMVFISHSSRDRNFAEALVGLLEDLGFDKRTLFCSSIEGYGIGLSENIFEKLRDLFSDHDLFVMFIHSPRYYTSYISLNEMGAAWVLKTDFCSFLTTDMEYGKMSGVVNGDTVSIKVDAVDASSLLTELKDKLTALFNLNHIDSTKWERKRDAFLRTVKSIKYEGTATEAPSTIVDDEYVQLQKEKLKQEALTSKQAVIRGNIVESPTMGNRILKIFNAGKASARDVSVEWLNPDSGVIVQWEFGLIGEITPQNSRSYHITLTNGHPETMRLRYTWADSNKEDNLFEEDLQI